MFKSILFCCLAAIVSVPAWAATDAEIAQKCVSGAKRVASSGTELTYLAGGVLRGLKHTKKHDVTFEGTWDVKQGILHQHLTGETGSVSDASFPIRMDQSGRCLFTSNGSEHPLKK